MSTSEAFYVLAACYPIALFVEAIFFKPTPPETRDVPMHYSWWTDKYTVGGYLRNILGQPSTLTFLAVNTVLVLISPVLGVFCFIFWPVFRLLMASRKSY